MHSLKCCLPGLLLWAGLVGVVAQAWAGSKEASKEDPCRSALAEFEAGVEAYELGDDAAVLLHMHNALLEEERLLGKPECLNRKGELKAVWVPYGRWKYEFAPDVFMGVALARLADCSEKTIKGSKCRRAVDTWWKKWKEPARGEGSEGEPGLDRQVRELRNDKECLMRSKARCSKQDGRWECGPSVDWWQSLTASRVVVDSGKLADFKGDCKELRGMVALVLAVFGGRDPGRATCKELVAELKDVLNTCPDVKLSDEWFGPTSTSQ